MINMFTVVFMLNIIAIIIMIHEAKKLHVKNNGFYNRNVKYSVSELHSHKNAIQLLIFIGIAGGVLLWGILIGAIISFANGNFQHLANSFNISVTISFIPSALGVWKVYYIRGAS